MLIAALIILGFGAATVTLSFVVVAFAPEGYEDETGFHLGPERDSGAESLTVYGISGAKATA